MTLVLIFGIPVVLIILAALIGLRLPKTHVTASRIRLSATPEEVWAIISDFASHPTWRPGLAKVEEGPEVDGHPTWYEFCARNIRVQFSHVEVDPPKRMVTKLIGEELPMRGIWTYEIAKDGGDTILTITENNNIYNPLLRFFAKFVISYYGAMDIFLIALARKLGESAQPEHLSLKHEAP